jgi:DNA-binding NarL/FixJ family response regulator
LKPVKLLIADEHPIVMDGLVRLIDPAQIELLGFVKTTEELAGALESDTPQVLVSDVRLGGIDVMKPLESFAVAEAKFRIVFFSAHSNPTYIARAATLNCYDYLLKTSPTSELIEAVLAAGAGKPTPPESLLIKTRKRARKTSQWDQVVVTLTQREKQVLQHVALGLSNREIGRSLGISVETVKEHVQNTLRKLDANDRTQAAVWAVRQGLI